MGGNAWSRYSINLSEFYDPKSSFLIFLWVYWYLSLKSRLLKLLDNCSISLKDTELSTAVLSSRNFPFIHRFSQHFPSANSSGQTQCLYFPLVALWKVIAEHRGKDSYLIGLPHAAIENSVISEYFTNVLFSLKRSPVFLKQWPHLTVINIDNVSLLLFKF